MFNQPLTFVASPAFGLQLPPVCKCVKPNPKQACTRCHISSASKWSEVLKFNLTCSLRHAADPEYSAFLSIIRLQEPTAKQIEDALPNELYMDAAAVVTTATEHTTVLCSHLEQVDAYNPALLAKFFPPDDAAACVDIPPLLLPATADKAVERWATDPNFHCVPRLAVDSRVMVSDNAASLLGQPPSYLCGDMARVVTITPGIGMDPSDIHSITIKLDRDGSLHTVTRTVSSSKRFNRVMYKRYTFPLRSCTVFDVQMRVRGDPGEDNIQPWIEEKGFHHLTKVCVGARVVLTHNVEQPKGAANGAPGVVEQVCFDDANRSWVKSIKVRLTETGLLYSLSRSTTADNATSNATKYVRTHSTTCIALHLCITHYDWPAIQRTILQ